MNTYPYDAVIFDLDGTLFDAEDGIVSSVKSAMEQMELEVPAEADLRKVVGPPLRDSFEHLLKVPVDRIDEAVKLYAVSFLEQGMFQYAVYPHIRHILQMLHESHVHVGLASTKPQGLCERILTYFGLAHFFDAIVGETNDRATLGKPELIRRALPERYELAAMVGDRCYDMEGAKAAGVEGVGVSYGCGGEQELQDAGATHIVPDTEALRALLCPGGDIPRGFFLTMEGLDGSGKTTQADLLEKSLRQFGFTILRTREPGGCDISEDIRHIILDTENMEMCASCEALLYAASRAQHVHQVIKPAVERGMVVLSDRFVDSSVAYQGGGRELGVDTVQQINAPAVMDMLPDATLYLAIDHTTALNRRLSASTPDRLELEDGEFYERVQKAYERLIRENKKRFMVVDAERDIESIQKDVLTATLNRLEPEFRREA
ncbi:MAG: dTMP kinase [Eubacteriales bacterium]|nr:dTMP kinase [Eubacteriales bacterium]